MPAQPFHLAPQEPWARNQVADSHNEALYAFGEYAYFVLMWTPKDYDDGLVDHCPRCFVTDRFAQAYQQAGEERCPECYGSTFEGGYRARIVRPALFTDRVPDTNESPRGFLYTDQVTVETTSDFTFHHGDYVLRYDGARFQCEEASQIVVRTGFEHADPAKSIGGVIAGARLEDKNAVAYVIPPDDATVRATLNTLRVTNSHLAPDLSDLEDVRPNGYLLTPDEQT